MNSFYRLALSCSAAAFLAACAASTRISNKLPNTFLEHSDLSAKIKHLPFDHSWSDPSVRWSTYKSVIVKPVRTDLLSEDAWRASAGVAILSKESYQTEVNDLGAYFHQQLIEAIKRREGKYMANIASSSGPGVAVLEIALTEVEFSHPLQKAAALAAPVPGISLAASAISDPFVTFALRITDGATSKLLATAADRKYAPRRIINLNKLTATSANREICQLWAEEFAETLGTDSMTEINEVTWSLLPW